ncbi:MAG: cupin domain-containing protein [Actinobacteria bacterium]|uniref:Unannotated protein n=1 Tax=freshwater metagenome TaxID=449393 RepID=A0A6J6SNL6_9ZZZZ|nr:cupin domain-containing protein [Actinomycetota bacterium]MSW79405.1 cupin domain-containing protein [Actinomycetota bacterium]MSX56591.1 cupin domain-containing protein [Actinomycetota bacterium]MSZ84012.1 cupin domain-containing protein [Actinomycetota bacterium]MTB19769.1 cupin domain-containing protein [Actinomycetota bacterium]
MKFFSAAAMAEMSEDVPAATATLLPHWVEGPHIASRLDVGIVTMSAGGCTPQHSHDGGQVLVVTAGTGFVEVVGGERRIVTVGDMIVAQPGEIHIHGALGDGAFAHLTVTTLGYQFPAAPVDAGPVVAAPIAPSA